MHAQDTLKTLQQSDFLLWNTLQDIQLSADAAHITYRVVPGEGDPTLCIYAPKDKSTFQLQRTSKSNIDYEGKFIFGMITPHRDSLRSLERKKVDKKEWPCDTLFITSGDAVSTLRIPYVTQYKYPSKQGDWLAYTIKQDAIAQDTSTEKKKSKKEIVHLIVRQLSTGREDTLMNVKDFVWAEKSPVLMAIVASSDSTQKAGVVVWKDHHWTYIKKQKGDYAKCSLSTDGGQLAFLGNLDTTKAQIQPWELFYYDFKADSAVSIAATDKSFFPMVSQNADLKWSDDGRYLFYGRAEMPFLKDTTLLPDESVDVEIWSTADPDIYPMQNVNKANEEKRSYAYAYDTQTKKHTGINSLQWESSVFTPERNGRYVLVYTEKPYRKEATWEGQGEKDIALVDLQTGTTTPVRKDMHTQPRLSPAGKYAYGYSEADSTWWTYQIVTGVFTLMNTKSLPAFYDEENDVPAYPNGYGAVGWLKDDQALIIYDRYDIWSWSPMKARTPVLLTHGRDKQIIYRYIRANPEEKSLSPDAPWLLHVKSDITKSTAYSWFSPVTNTLDSFDLIPFEYSTSVAKARSAEAFIYWKENFATFPDIQFTTDRFKTSTRISDANPQQKNYKWGTIELYHWMDWDSVMRVGLLVKPAGYDTLRSYPTIVNFYERSSDDLNLHRTPAPHRSTINYAFYASRGYVIFNPDITYAIGKPGESAYQIVMSGITNLVKDRIADNDNLALQGHSWGGYQIAYILTRTNMFKCAEAGASVVNMTSAYLGIRGETGLSRMFQYEHEQSRLGKSLWEDPNLYITNSPLFKINKIETPLLLLHNNEDGHVPFEQGVEFYSALRRLGKTAWLLNYRGEPHWPVKWENKKDFNVRMAQFFDHYLKGAPMPEWMEKGIPAVQRGINRGY